MNIESIARAHGANAVEIAAYLEYRNGRTSTGRHHTTFTASVKTGVPESRIAEIDYVVSLAEAPYPITLYVYSNETGEQVGSVTGPTTEWCERTAAGKWCTNDFHFSGCDVPVSNGV